MSRGCCFPLCCCGCESAGEEDESAPVYRPRDDNSAAPRQPSPDPLPPPAAAPDSAGIEGNDSAGAVAENEARTPLEKYYVKDSTALGTGAFGTVYAAHRKGDNLPVAIKVVPKKNIHLWEEVENHMVPMEIFLLRKVQDVPGVIQLLDYVEGNNAFYLVLERPRMCKDLFDYVTDKGVLSESQARHFFRQILTIVQGISQRGVLHRDIKEENILVDLTTGQLKLIDFGSGEELHDGIYTCYGGTPHFCPPEVVSSQPYRAMQATVWSLGVLLYSLLCGSLPFPDNSQVLREEPAFSRGVSLPAQDLVRRCLSKRPADRPGLEAVLAHPWVRGQGQGQGEEAGDPRLFSIPEDDVGILVKQDRGSPNTDSE